MKQIVLLIAVLLAGMGTAHAQQGTVQGTVRDAQSGDPLPGANISIVGTSIGAVSGPDGEFSLSVAPGEVEIQASFVGFGLRRTVATVAAGAVTTVELALSADLIGAGELVVIGSRNTGRSVIESAVPVDVLTPRDLEAIGYTETTQLLNLLIPSYNTTQSSITDGTDHVRPATLRGLGPDHVLVLINGKRRHTGALVHVNGSMGRGSTGVDLNAIPASAIERVEVLRDGAAAQYGSDAIAGVINIVLKERAGFDANVSYGQHLSSVTRGYAESEGLLPDARDAGSDAYSWDGDGVNIGSPEDVTYTDGETVNVNLGYGAEVGEGTMYISATLRDRGYTNRAGLDPRGQYYDGFGGANYTEETIDRLNHRFGNGSFTEYAAFLNGSMPVGAAQAYIFGGYSYRDGQSGCYFRRSLDNRTNRDIYPDGFLPMIAAKVADGSIAGGIKGAFGDWAYDLSETFGTNAFTFDMENTHNASQRNGQTEFDAGTLFFAQSSTNLDLFRSFDMGFSSPVSVALGAEFRYENYQIRAGEENSYANGGIPVDDGPSAGAGTAAGCQCFPGFSPSSEQDEARTNVGVYLDVETDITSALQLGIAGRFENYSDFGSTFTGKVAGRYEINPVIALRGAASTGYRAPSLAQSWFTSIATNFIDGVPFEVGTFAVASPTARALGAKDLTPETSINFSAGITFATEMLSLTVDAYQVDITDRITFTENFTGSTIADFLATRGINANGGRFFTNAIDSKTQGIDIIARYGTSVAGGDLRLTLGANFTDTEVTNLDFDSNGDGELDAIAAPDQLKALGKSTLVGRNRIGDYQDLQPNSKINAQVNFDKGALALMLRVNRFGEVTNLHSSDPVRDQTLSAKVLTDMEVAYRLGGGLRFSVGANNLLDVYPDKSFKSSSFNGIFPYSGASPFGFSGRFVYTRLTYHL